LEALRGFRSTFSHRNWESRSYLAAMNTYPFILKVSSRIWQKKRLYGKVYHVETSKLLKTGQMELDSERLDRMLIDSQDHKR
jgi:hypothetical protein